MNFEDLICNPEQLDAVSRDIARSAVNTSFKAVGNRGLTPDDLTDRIRRSSIPNGVKDDQDAATRSLIAAARDVD